MLSQALRLQAVFLELVFEVFPRGEPTEGTGGDDAQQREKPIGDFLGTFPFERRVRELERCHNDRSSFEDRPDADDVGVRCDHWREGLKVHRLELAR